MNKNKNFKHFFLLLAIFFPTIFLCLAENINAPFHEWQKKYSLSILNESSWSQQETYIRQLRGIGSGIQGEKEIYNTYFVRFLSAKPIRKAFARIKELHIDYDSLSAVEKLDFDAENKKSVDLDLKDWIVVSVAFRSNVPREESRVDQFLMSQTTETVKNRVYLSTKRFPKLEIAEYIAPTEKIVGAKFIFPRIKDGIEIVTAEDEKIIFEFNAPGSDPLLRTTFDIKIMIRGGELII
jgi:hypothetical protein